MSNAAASSTDLNSFEGDPNRARAGTEGAEGSSQSLKSSGSSPDSDDPHDEDADRREEEAGTAGEADVDADVEASRKAMAKEAIRVDGHTRGTTQIPSSHPAQLSDY